MKNIIFLDFDGVMIPRRAYFMANQTKGIVTKFDPCAVGMLNSLCEKHDAKIVLVTSWRKTNIHGKDDLIAHIIEEGIDPKHVHTDHSCPTKFSSSKYHDMGFWLEDHPEVEKAVVIDDDLSPEYAGETLKKPVEVRFVVPDFNEGLTYKNVQEISDHFLTEDERKEIEEKRRKNRELLQAFVV